MIYFFQSLLKVSLFLFISSLAIGIKGEDAPVVDFDQSLGKDVKDGRKAFQFNDFILENPTYSKTWDMAVQSHSTREVYEQLKALYDKNLPFKAGGLIYKIPPIIHQIWIQDDVPGKYAHWQKTWQERMPGWTYILWTDEDIKQLPLINRGLYEKESNPGTKSDLARIEILNMFGGLYVDLDSECVQPVLLQKLLKSHSFFCGISPLACGVFCLNNALIGSVAGHPILQDYLQTITEWALASDTAYYKLMQVPLLGPVPFTKSVVRAIDQPGYVDVVLPPTFFYPLSFTDSHKKIPALKKLPECIALDHWDGAWVNYQPNKANAKEPSYEQSPSLTGSHLPKSMRKRMVSPTPWLSSREALLQQLPKGGVVVEIGVQEGHFSAAILQYARPTKLYLIDAWEEQASEEYPDEFGNVDQHSQDGLYEKVKKRFEGDSRVEVIKAFSPQAAKLFEDEFFDWIYVDANHIYQAARDDLAAWSKKVKKGGFICGHDYTNDAPYSIGVVAAVNEFLKYNKVELAYLTTDHWASYALKKGKKSGCLLDIVE